MHHEEKTMSFKQMLLLSAAAAALPLVAASARADAPAQAGNAAVGGELSELKAQIQLLSDRLKQLETQAQAEKLAAAPAPPQAPIQAPMQARTQTQTQSAAAAGLTSMDTPEALKTDNSGNLIGFLSRPVMLYDDGNTSARLYGIIEVTISYASNQNAQGDSAIGFQTSWFSGNRLGFDFDHALQLGDRIGLPGLKVITKLETEFESPTGNSDTPGVLFNRDAWLGFYSPGLGKLTFGRQNTLTRDFTQTWGDPYGTPDVTLKEGGYSNVNNYKQIIFYSGSDTLTRNNSGIVWKKRYGEHWLVGLDYAFGSEGVGGSGNGCSYAGAGNFNSCFNSGGGATPGQFSLGSNESASLAYNNLSFAGGRLSGNINYNRVNNADNVNQAVLIGGTYVKGIYRLGAGYIHYIAEQGADHSAPVRIENVWTANGSIRFLPDTDLYLGYTWTVGHNAGLGGNGDVILPFIQYSGAVTQVASGRRADATASIMYHADKQTDFYIASDYMAGFGAWSHALFDDMQNNPGPLRARADEVMLGTGVRFKF
jgi:predicted porin